ncbi:hypothetical protein FIU87_11465 [Bacillus sp. THAF10]|uniref:Fur-regulated basic protein FbpA n=1 Tax=Bacillus sp. THAF10 TaxID=2587848 RepID=UPI001267C309|nr:Fur-regulated basic protein FbpA [Bacillus sp. THAF10]QFT89268.1 hypothetical protein FIU87_11465 [Bacillus sp. THAF10]
MAGKLHQAITFAREYYIDALVKAGYFVHQKQLSAYTLSELKKEYSTLILPRKKDQL